MLVYVEVEISLSFLLHSQRTVNVCQLLINHRPPAVCLSSLPGQAITRKQAKHTCCSKSL